jgi:hypothetical protein
LDKILCKIGLSDNQLSEKARRFASLFQKGDFFSKLLIIASTLKDLSDLSNKQENNHKCTTTTSDESTKMSESLQELGGLITTVGIIVSSCVWFLRNLITIAPKSKNKIQTDSSTNGTPSQNEEKPSQKENPPQLLIIDNQMVSTS